MKEQSAEPTQSQLLRSLPCDFAFESKAREDGAIYISGADEVGRGCLGGSVYAGCIILTPPGFAAVENTN